MSNHRLAKSAADAHWFEIKRQLEYKADWYDKKVEIINENNTSKTCNVCGYKNEDLTLAVREWICPICGIHDRDVNAAKNILSVGMTGMLVVKST
ncbi:MAG: conserved hypothetical protein partial [Methanobrevibacter sp. CfCl-M3]